MKWTLCVLLLCVGVSEIHSLAWKGNVCTTWKPVYRSPLYWCKTWNSATNGCTLWAHWYGRVWDPVSGCCAGWQETSVGSKDCSQKICKSGWKAFGGHCYLFRECSACSPNDAVTACKNIAGIPAILTPVRSSQHNDFLLSQIPNKEVYLGGSDSAKEATWIWSDGTPFVCGFVNFGDGAPTSGTNTNYNCLRMDNTDKKWYDETCTLNDNNMVYVCEEL